MLPEARCPPAEGHRAVTISEFRSMFSRRMQEHGLSGRIGSSRDRDIESFLAWAELRRVDPERWVLARHEAVKWRHRVAIDKLASEKFLKNFRRFGDSKQAIEVSRSRFDDVKLSGSLRRKEAARIAFRLHGDLHSCLMTALYGDRFTSYDPESAVCPVCPFLEQCRGS